MARDLIPPPAPSWRALQPDGTPNLIELPPERDTAEEPAPPPPPSNLPPSRFRNRFGFLMGALGGALLAAVAVLAIVLSTNDGPSEEGLYSNWSKWKPQETTITAGPAEIATHVGSQYKGEDGKQLVAVKGGPLEIQGIKLGVVMQSAKGDIQELNGTTVLYTLSGLGPGGSIKGGTPSTERHQLLRREALELALYTFRYMPSADMVMALLPPPPPKEGEDATTTAPPTQAVFYRPGDLKSQLQVPLGATVPAKAPTANAIPAAEARRIDSLTLSNLFQAAPRQFQDLGAYMVLDRPS